MLYVSRKHEECLISPMKTVKYYNIVCIMDGFYVLQYILRSVGTEIHILGLRSSNEVPSMPMYLI